MSACVVATLVRCLEDKPNESFSRQNMTPRFSGCCCIRRHRTILTSLICGLHSSKRFATYLAPRRRCLECE